MKVLKRGDMSQPSEWTGKYLCTGFGNGGYGCGALLLLTKSDLFHTTSCALDKEMTKHITFLCSECGKKTDIYSSDFPSQRGKLPLGIAWGSLPNEQEWQQDREAHNQTLATEAHETKP
jgi:hypothetical protein